MKHDEKSRGNEDVARILRGGRTKFSPQDAALLRAYLRTAGWLPEPKGRWWAVPEYAREHGRRGEVPSEWADHDLGNAARLQLQRERRGAAVGACRCVDCEPRTTCAARGPTTATVTGVTPVQHRGVTLTP